MIEQEVFTTSEETEETPEMESIVEPEQAEEAETAAAQEAKRPVLETVTPQKHTLTATEKNTAIEPDEEEDEKDRKRKLLIGSACGAAVAVLLMTIGFGRTLFLGVMSGAGAFIYGVKDKQQWLKDTVNRLFPPRS